MDDEFRWVPMQRDEDGFEINGPTEEGKYLITIKTENDVFVDIDYLNSGRGGSYWSVYFWSQIVAWAHVPNPYK